MAITAQGQDALSERRESSVAPISPFELRASTGSQNTVESGSSQRSTLEERERELRSARERKPALYFEYTQDAREFAPKAEGPFSFRIPNGSQSALLYGTIPDPRRPVEMGTHLHRDQALKGFEDALVQGRVMRADSGVAPTTEKVQAGVAPVPQTSAAEEKYKAISKMSMAEILTEVRDLHSQFQQLSGEYKQSAGPERAHIREEMKPLVEREGALRQEYTGRTSQELSRDKAPEQIGFSR